MKKMMKKLYVVLLGLLVSMACHGQRIVEPPIPEPLPLWAQYDSIVMYYWFCCPFHESVARPGWPGDSDVLEYYVRHKITRKDLIYRIADSVTKSKNKKVTTEIEADYILFLSSEGKIDTLYSSIFFGFDCPIYYNDREYVDSTLSKRLTEHISTLNPEWPAGGNREYWENIRRHW